MDADNLSFESHLKERTVIPRWKSPKSAIETSAFDPKMLKRRQASVQTWVQRLNSTYQQFPSESSANELYELTTMYGLRPELDVSVIANIQNSRKKIDTPILSTWQTSGEIGTPAAAEIGTSVEANLTIARSNIRELRKLVKHDPNRPLCWSELSRYYLVVAEPDKAIQSMRIALQLTKNNRYLQRAATKLFVHLRDPEQALNLLRSNPALTKDPWLLSAEIATTSSIKKSSKYIHTANGLLNSSIFNEYQISELASAIGTVEFEHGVTKKAKALFNKSLISPTENSLAQAQWAVAQDSKIIIPDSAWLTPASYEAKALAARQSGAWKEAIDACALWLAEEPFSLEPCLMGSYFGLWPNLAKVAEQFATAGLRTQSTNRDGINLTFLNNRAVARAFQGKLPDAYHDFERAISIAEGVENAYLIATLGLIAFRSGYPEEGRDCYRQSIAWFTQAKEHSSAARAMLYLAREEVRAKTEMVPQAMAIAKKIANSTLIAKVPELKSLSELIIEELKNTNISNDINYTVPTRNEFKQQASRFSVPNAALKLLAGNRSYNDLVKL